MRVNPMAFDGIPRPSQLIPYGEGMNPHAAANAAHLHGKDRPLIKSPDEQDKVKGLQREGRQEQPRDESEHDRGEPFTEEEAEALLLFARMRGVLNLSLESNVRYEFRMNLKTGLVDLIESETDQWVMSLTPIELAQLADKINRYVGTLTDSSG